METASLEITCTVKGYQECRFTVDVGEEFSFIRSLVLKEERSNLLLLGDS